MTVTCLICPNWKARAEKAEARVAELESEIKEARNEAATVRRAYLHEKYRADQSGAPRTHAYSGPADRFITAADSVSVAEKEPDEEPR
jgi:hypothetical protein